MHSNNDSTAATGHTGPTVLVVGPSQASDIKRALDALTARDDIPEGLFCEVSPEIMMLSKREERKRYWESPTVSWKKGRRER